LEIRSLLMQDLPSEGEGEVGLQRQVDLAGAAHLELVSGVVQLRPQDAMVEAMLRGWRAQQVARGLREDTVAPRERLVRRFLEYTNEYPWAWAPGHVDEWSLWLTSEKHLAPSTIRSYQGSLRLFSEFLTDGRYGWAVACQDAFGTHPVAICHEWNTIAHLNDYEGSPEARPFTREEIQRFLDYADDQVDRAVRSKRKGALAAYRDATLFKVIYGWGLRRTEAAKLDLVDFGRNASAPQFGRYGTLNVRFGKAKRGQPPRRRNVGDGLGGGGGGRLRGERSAAVRLRGPSRAVGDRARWPDQAGGDQRQVRRLPRRAEASEGAGRPLRSPCLRHPPHGGRG
jgi:integrase/recombinase XerC